MGKLLKGGPIANGNQIPLGSYETISFEHMERDCHAGTTNAKHNGQEFVRDRQFVSLDSVMAYKKPASEAFFNVMGRIGKGRKCALDEK